MATKKPSGPDSHSRSLEEDSENAAPQGATVNGKAPASRPARGARPGAPVPAGARHFTIVGVGASAGGLEAFTELLHELPADTHMAFVFVQHYRPGHPSMLSEILSRETQMPVSQVAEGLALEPDHIYVHTGYEALGVRDNRFTLRAAPAHEHQHLPIDHFFADLSHQGMHAIGVVLSGTASDGTLGLKAITALGGITMVQDLESARYDGMPASALAAGAASLVLSPAAIARELTRLAHHPYLVRPETAEALDPSKQDASLREVFRLLKERFDVDFTYYKHSTLLRRIGRRLLVNNIETISDYARYLQDHPQEQEALYYDMLINVTAFFRDQGAFEALRNQIFPALLEHHDAHEPLRIWVPGCASGEEVYSIAITLLESLSNRNNGEIAVQLFGTDVDERAVAQARAGVYPRAIEQDVPAEYLQRYFDELADGFQIHKDVRDLCVFSVHNVLTDPPFSRLDLISCRNLLIYLGPVLQKKVMPVFHFALKPGGYLLLGTAETIGDATHLFQMTDARAKAYRKKSVNTPQLGLKFAAHGSRAPIPPATPGTEHGTQENGLRLAGEQLLLDEFAPPAVIIDDKMQIQRYYGHSGRFLEPAPGSASLNLLKMVRESLAAELRGAVMQAVDRDERVHKERLRLGEGQGIRNIAIDVVPLSSQEAQRYFLVVFHEQPFAPPALKRSLNAEVASPIDEQELQSLQQELSATRDYLNAVIEQQETQNEELRCANEEVQSSYEELQSTNEELQSTNEELETAKEELQSSNEELRSVNEQLQTRNLDLTQANDDLNNLIASTDMAALIVDPDLRIRRFTPRAAALFHIEQEDLDQPVERLRPNIALPDLIGALRRAIDRVETVEWERRDQHGHWYLTRIMPYITTERRIEGAVLVIFDIDRLKDRPAAPDNGADCARAIVAAVHRPLLVLDRNLRVVQANRACARLLGLDEEGLRGASLHRLASGPWKQPQLLRRIESLLEGDRVFENFPVQWTQTDGRQRHLSISATRIDSNTHEGPLLLIEIDQPPATTDKSA